MTFKKSLKYVKNIISNQKNIDLRKVIKKMKDLTNRLLHESDKHVEARELRYLVLKKTLINRYIILSNLIYRVRLKFDESMIR